MFYVSSVFMEVLNQFGEINDDVASKQRYAAWRAGELSRAAKEGRPAAPPPEDDERAACVATNGVAADEAHAPSAPPSWGPPPGVGGGDAPAPGPSPGAFDGAESGNRSIPGAGLEMPRGMPRDVASWAGHPTGGGTPPPPSYMSDAPVGAVLVQHVRPVGGVADGLGSGGGAGGVSQRPHAHAAPAPPPNLPPVGYADGIHVAHIAEAQKHARFAVSALGYEDVNTAMDNLEKALALLRGQMQP